MLSHTPVREVIEEARSLTNCMKIVVLYNVCLLVIIRMTCTYIYAYLGTQAPDYIPSGLRFEPCDCPFI
jgi:hypothetical protein